MLGPNHRDGRRTPTGTARDLERSSPRSSDERTFPSSRALHAIGAVVALVMAAVLGSCSPTGDEDVIPVLTTMALRA